MRKGARVAVIATVALALPVAITLATYAIAASSLAPQAWLSISVDSHHQVEPAPAARPSNDADRQQHRGHRHTPLAPPTTTPAPVGAGAPITGQSPGHSPGGDDGGGDGSSGSGSGKDN
jgi:hypothetical protein